MATYNNWPMSVSSAVSNFGGTIYDGKGNVWGIPLSASALVKVNTITNAMTAYPKQDANLPTDARFAGGALIGDDIWMVPEAGRTVAKFDTLLSTWTKYNSWPAGVSITSSELDFFIVKLLH